MMRLGRKSQVRGRIPFYVSTVTGKGDKQDKDVTVINLDRNQTKLLQDITKEGKYATEVDQEGAKQERYRQEGES